MLYEIDKPRQIENEGFRRWFTDEDCDLIVWYTDDGALEGFQYCYDKNSKERCLTWKKTGSYVHAGVDDGEVYGQNKMSPVLVSDGIFDKWSIAEEFKKTSAEIDPKISGFVYRKIVEYD